MDKLRIECVLKVQEDYEGKQAELQKDMAAFFLKHFQ